MAMTPEERTILERIGSNVADMHADMPSLKAELIKLRRSSNAQDDRLDRHDFRIGRVEQHVGLVDHHARVQSQSIPPKSPEDLGLTASDSGVHYLTKDVEAIIRQFERQDVMRQGAELALENERILALRKAESSDRLLKRLSWGGGTLLAVASVIAYLIGHFKL